MRIFSGLLLLFPILAWGDCPPMESGEARRQVARLQAEVDYHNDLYFNKYQPVLSDDEFDALKGRLTSLQNCFHQQAGQSKSQFVVGGDITHESFMGSLRKASSEQEVAAFIHQAGDELILLQPKIDGIAIELVYRNGLLVAASTRGDGHTGKNILDKVEHIPAIPLQLPKGYRDVVLHGELFARLDLWQRPDKNTSARHYAAGLINRQKADADALGTLDFFPWRWLDSPHDSDNTNLNMLVNLGFDLPTLFTYKVESLAEAKQLRDKLQNPEKPLPFLLDGVVLKLSNLKLRKALGWKNDEPAWALAWKFPAQAAVSTITDIQFRIGRTGNITPVVYVEPVTIGGETIRKLSLGSSANLKRKGMAIGDEISIQLKGAATPVAGKVLIRPENRQAPQFLDSKRYNAFTCLQLSPGCKEQLLSRLRWFAGKTALQLPHLQEPVLRSLLEKGAIKSLPDIMTVPSSALAEAGLEPGQINELLTSLKKAGATPFDRQLRSMSLPGIGKARSKKLATFCKNWQRLLELSQKEVQEMAGIGPAEYQSLKQYLQQPEVQALVKHFRQ
ncbi:MAG: helix-hairpin-helix domain-containing protein [Endozoicomonas sp.]